MSTVHHTQGRGEKVRLNIAQRTHCPHTKTLLQTHTKSALRARNHVGTQLQAAARKLPWQLSSVGSHDTCTCTSDAWCRTSFSPKKCSQCKYGGVTIDTTSTAETQHMQQLKVVHNGKTAKDKHCSARQQKQAAYRLHKHKDLLH